MKTFSEYILSRLFALLAALALALAQSGALAQPAYVFSQQELDQMLAPIALYPDALLSQILMASTYPLEVAEAARWSVARPGLLGDDAVRAAERENWDPSVKSLVAFPQVIERMGENLPWTQALGDAFLDQQAQVMDTVQALRRRAEAAGNLRSNDRLRVFDSGSGLMVVEPLNPQVVYIPDYDPSVVYGLWWWPAYPPIYWRPWPGYARGFYWGPPVGISVGFFFGGFDWPRRQVRVVPVNNYYYSQSAGANRALIANRAPGAWHHEPEHRRGIAYRGVETQPRLGAASAPRGQDNRAGSADPRRSDARIDVRPAARPETRPEVRSDGRRPDARPAAATRANVQPAPATPLAPAIQSAPADKQFDHRRETGARMPPAQPAPVMQSAPAVNPATVVHPSPVVNPAPVMQPAPPAQHRPGARHEARKAGEPASEAHPSQAATRRDAAAEPVGRTRAGR